MKSLLVLALLTLPLAAALQAPSSPKERPDSLDNDNNCEDVGVEWVNPHVGAPGAAVCTGDEFILTIGYNDIGVGVTFKATGCPSYLIIEPGHWATVQKNGYFITTSTFREGIKSYYKCGTWGKNTCEPNASKPDENDPTFGATSYEARACPN